MGKKLSYDFVKNYVESFDVKLLSKVYINSNEKIELRCKNCGESYFITFPNFKKIKKVFCNKCSFAKNGLKRRHSLKYVKSIVEGRKFLLLNDQYEGNTKKIYLIDKNGYKYVTTFATFSKGGTPDRFSGTNIFTIDNIKLWIEKQHKDFSFVEGVFKNAIDSSLVFRCKECGCTWNSSWMVIFGGQSCPYRNGKRVSSKNNLAYLRPDLALEWDYSKNYPLKPTDVVYGTKKKFYWICNFCGRSYLSSCLNRFNGSACRFCIMSGGECRIDNWLKNNDTNYIFQYSFDNLRTKNNRMLKYDFGVFNDCKKLKFLLEYNGKQHYEPIEFFGGKEIFELQKYRDKMKEDYCKKNNIKLIAIPYWDFNNIESILEKKLNLNKNFS